MTKPRKPSKPRIDTLIRALSDNGYGNITMQPDGRIIASKSESVQPFTQTGAKSEWPTKIGKRV